MSRNCNNCNKQIIDSNFSAFCIRCKKSFHPECVNLGSKELEFLKENKGTWYCPACSSSERRLRSNSGGSRAASPLQGTCPPLSDSSEMNLTTKHFELLMNEMRKMTASLERVEKRQDDLMARLDICAATIDSHSETLISHKSEIDSCKREIATMKDAQLAVNVNISSLSDKINDMDSKTSSANNPREVIVPEVIDRVKRSFNLIISNVPESDEATDIVTVSKICDLVNASSSKHISNVIRLQSRDRNRPRWIRVSFTNPEIVQTILRKKNSILGTSQYRSVKIQDDKTKEQLSQLTSLRAELRDRLTAGETNLTIKYIKGCPKIVNIPSPLNSVNSKN